MKYNSIFCFLKNFTIVVDFEIRKNNETKKRKKPTMTFGLTGPMLATVKLQLRVGSMSPYDTIPHIYMVV